MSNIKSKPRGRERLDPVVRRELLLDELLVQVTHQGFASISMESIARSGNIAKTVVYNAFGDVDGALNALFTREQERTITAVVRAIPLPPFDGEPSDVALEALRGILDDVRRHPDSWRLLLVPGPGTPPGVRASIERHRHHLVGLIRPAVGWVLAHYGAEQLDEELLAFTAVAIVEHSVRLVLEHPEDFGIDRVVGSFSAVIETVGQRIATQP